VLNELADLAARQEHRRCIEIGEQLLAKAGPATRVEILLILCRSYRATAEIGRALDSAATAVALAEAVEDAGVLASALAELGMCALACGDRDAALLACARFWEVQQQHPAQADVLTATGEMWRQQGLYREASRCFEKAVLHHLQAGDLAAAQRCRHLVVHAELRGGNSRRALQYLKEGESYLATLPQGNDALVTHLLDWSAFLQQMGDHSAGARLAFSALNKTQDVSLQATAQLLLAEAARCQERPVEAFSFALAARISASDTRRYDLEFESTALLIALVQVYGLRLVDEVEREFRQQGVNLFQYVSRDWYDRYARSERTT
jgi:tetratricopeptide (TPR) repeat protein